MRNWGLWEVRGIRAVLVLVASAAGGCARDRGPVRVDGFSRSSTLGSDLRRVPRGVTVPPPSLGVDLVRGGRAAPPRDPETGQAGFATARAR